MPRTISLIVLLGFLLLVGVLFFQVMAQFLLPLFLALVLVVMFRPVHRQFLSTTAGRHYVAAALTTITILLMFLLPLLTVGALATREAWWFYEAAVKRAGASPQAAALPDAAPAGEPDRQQVVDDVARRLAQRNDVAEVTIRFDEPPRGLNEQLAGALFDQESAAVGLGRLGEDLGIELDARRLAATMGDRIIPSLAGWLAPLGVDLVRTLGRVVFGLIVMTVAVFFFLADGPAMIRAVTQFSPLEDHYKMQLIAHFDQVSRAVVLATVLSAIAQGLLAGVAYYLVGLQAVFLLTALTMFMAMVPFVGAASVWLPAALWLVFVQDRLGAGIFLAVYGAAVVSTSDNVIKPLVLHGRSNIHPLLALLSVLGGVQVLGPIGIFVGPMLVAFLQTLMGMVQTELRALKDRPAAMPEHPAEAGQAAASAEKSPAVNSSIEGVAAG